MANLRSDEAQKIYSAYRKNLPPNAPCPLCEEKSIQDFEFWRVITNNFPYDTIAKTHHMLVPRRHVDEQSLSSEELAELIKIKHGMFHNEYDWFIEAAMKNKSIPAHYHLHLIVAKG